MIIDKNIIIISSIDWNFNWQGPQEIASRMAQAGNRVLFIENTGVRHPKLKDSSRVWQRLKYWYDKTATRGFVEAEPNLYICSPIVLPPFGSRLRGRINREIFFPRIKKIAEHLEMRDPIILTFLPTDTALQLIKLLKGETSKVLYYVAGDFRELVSDHQALAQSENEIARMSNAILTTCDSLTDRYKPFNPRVYTLPYGVDLSAFQNGDKTSASDSINHLISALKNEKRPVVGYVGAFHRYMNTELLLKAVSLKKDWLWVFVGPIDEEVANLRKLPNVLFLGQQWHTDLVYFIKNFDVCIIPYIENEYTKTVVPVKLNEYLAVGKPVVSTDIPNVLKFNDLHDVVKITRNQTDEFLHAIKESLVHAENLPAIEKRKSVAALSDWKLHFENICRILNSP